MIYIKQSLKDFLESQANTNSISSKPQSLDSKTIEIPIPSESSMLKVESKGGTFSLAGVMEMNSDNYTNLMGIRMSDLSEQLSGPANAIMVYEVSGLNKVKITIDGDASEYIYSLII